MDYSKKQRELDVKKWVDSEIKNYDTCGEYCYCKNCNKNEAYPCACAYENYTNANKLSKTTSTTKTSKSKTLKTSTTSKKTSTSKKTTTKKSTTSKKTTAKA